jgi:phage-related protein
MSIAIELGQLAHDAIIEMFVIDARLIGGERVFLHAGTNQLSGPLLWQGQVYQPFPIVAEGFDRNSAGPLPRPQLKVSNVLGLVGAMVRDTRGMRGAIVTRRRTLAKYLDEANWPARRNLAYYTNDLSNGWWQAGGTTCTFSVGEPIPAGAGASQKMVPIAWPSPGYTATPFVDVVPGQHYVFSIRAKAAGYSFIGLRPLAGDANYMFRSVFDLSTGQFVSPVGDVHAQALGDGWYLIWGSGQASAAGLQLVIEARADPNLQSNFNGNGVDGIYVGGGQFEAGTVPSEYQPVAGSWSGNPTADPTAHFDDELWVIDRRGPSKAEVVTFELASPIDVAGLMLPRRQVIAGVCIAEYRSADCGYTGPAVARADNTLTGLMSEDDCGHCLQSCQLRSWPDNELPYWGYPGAGTIQEF